MSYNLKYCGFYPNNFDASALMPYFGLYVQLRRGSVAGYTTDESWAYGPKEGVEAFESITFLLDSYMRLIMNTYL